MVVDKTMITKKQGCSWFDFREKKKKSTDPNSKFYFGLIQFDLIIIEKSNQTKPI